MGKCCTPCAAHSTSLRSGESGCCKLIAHSVLVQISVGFWMSPPQDPIHIRNRSQRWCSTSMIVALTHSMNFVEETSDEAGCSCRKAILRQHAKIIKTAT